MENKAKAFQKECAKKAKDFWKQNVPLHEGVAKAFETLALSCGIKLVPKELKSGGIGMLPSTKEIFISPSAVKTIENYVGVYDELVEKGLKWIVRHEYFHAETNPLIVIRFAKIRNWDASEEELTTLVDYQVNKKLVRELMGPGYKTISIVDDWVREIKEKLDFAAAGITLSSLMGSKKDPEYWISHNCFLKIEDDKEFGFLSTTFKVLLNKSLREICDEVTCRAFRKELENGGEKKFS